MSGDLNWRVLVVALFFVVGGVAHFAATDVFAGIVPDYLPAPVLLVWISGVAELLGATGILIPRLRKLAGYGLIVLCIAVFPANLNMALHPQQFPDIPPWLLYLRLPLQLIIIGFIWTAIRPIRATSPSGV